jgi:hypothetical protein
VFSSGSKRQETSGTAGNSGYSLPARLAPLSTQGAALCVGGKFNLSPSLLSKKMVCPAFTPSSMSKKDWFHLMGIHALTVLKVIARHLASGYILEGIEARVNNGRVDLIFTNTADGKKRRVEVKSAREIRLYAKYQASLYWNGKDELVVSNSTADTILSREFMEDAIKLAKETQDFLTQRPEEAAKTFRPHEEVCKICANPFCPFLLAKNNLAHGEVKNES